MRAAEPHGHGVGYQHDDALHGHPSVGVLGTVLATCTRAALDSYSDAHADPHHALDADFVSHVLAGDFAHEAGASSEAIV